MLTRLSLSLAVSVGLLVGSTRDACAATIIKAVATPDFESQYTPDGRFAIDSANGVGLSSDLLTGDPVPGAYPTHNTNYEDQWLTAVPDSVTWITYDLGQNYAIAGLHQWNYNELGGTSRGTRNVSMTFSTTSPVAGFGSPFATTFSQAAVSGDTGQTISLPDLVLARYVRLDISSNWGSNHTGLAEIRFIAPDDGVLGSTPAANSTIKIGDATEAFASLNLSDAVELENTGAANTAVIVESYSISGADAAQFDLSSFAETILAGGDTVSFDVDFTGLAELRDYAAVVTFQTNVGDISFNLLVAAIPEPSTLALLAIGGLGCVQMAGRRRKRAFGQATA